MDRLRDAIRAAAVGSLQSGEAGEAARDHVFAEDFVGFSGHFPGYPILPAVVQVLTAQLLAEEAQGRALTLASVVNAKFLIQLRPGQKIRVSVRERKMGGRPATEGRLETAEGLAASFGMIFAQERPA